MGQLTANLLEEMSTAKSQSLFSVPSNGVSDGEGDPILLSK